MAANKISKIQLPGGGIYDIKDTRVDSLPNYWANQTLTTSAKYNSEPEVKSVKINGSSTNAASSSNCVLQYDTTNKCIKFVFN